jgi:hypothetical protein
MDSLKQPDINPITVPSSRPKRVRLSDLGLSDGVIENIRLRRSNGDSFRQIAKDLGVPYSSLYKFCHSPKYDVKKRKIEQADKRDTPRLSVNDLTIKHTSGRALTLVSTSLRVNPDGSEVHEFSIIVGPAE